MAKRKTMEEIQDKYDSVVDDTLQYVTPELVAADDTLLKYLGKQVVIRVCADCDDPFTIATSDLHQKPACDPCMDQRRKERKRAKKAALAE